MTDVVVEPAAPPGVLPGQAALEALIERHASFLYCVAFNLLRNPQDAEDAVQETLLKFVRTPAALAHLVDERAFLAAAVWRVGLNRVQSAHYRAQKRTQDIAVMPLRDPQPNPEEQVAALDQRALMRALIDKLPETLRQPLLLAAIEGMRGAEVASILGVPEATVRTRIHRAKAELREAFLQATTPRRQPERQVRA